MSVSYQLFPDKVSCNLMLINKKEETLQAVDRINRKTAPKLYISLYKDLNP